MSSENGGGQIRATTSTSHARPVRKAASKGNLMIIEDSGESEVDQESDDESEEFYL